MKSIKLSLVFFVCFFSLGSAQDEGAAGTDWRSVLKSELPRMGHRNFIVVADAAYPLQSATGIQTVATGETMESVLGSVLEAVEDAAHVRPVIYVDSELEFVDPEAAPGIDAYRSRLSKLLSAKEVRRLPHMEIIEKLDASAELFNVLILKTDLTLPYTSVFIELDCGYWSTPKEEALRAVFDAGE